MVQPDILTPTLTDYMFENVRTPHFTSIVSGSRKIDIELPFYNGVLQAALTYIKDSQKSKKVFVLYDSISKVLHDTTFVPIIIGMCTNMEQTLELTLTIPI